MGCGSSRSVGVKGSYRDCSDVFFTDGASSRGEPDGQEKHGNVCQSERKEAKYKQMNKTLTQSTYISSSSSSITEDTTEQALVKNAE
ncbi:hypothetical protein ACJMK2_017771 [Sinanodonta woodiana]|uniref:Uncharacterized protein n=1 Tax=Sinanodonta woodiana TaxID=1069815 RepID=A0ABD3UEX9_SINWO